MKIKFHSAIFLLLLLIAPLSHAVLDLPSNLVDFTSPKGQKFLDRSLEKSNGKKNVGNASKLLSHFITQDTTTYCGVASLVTILNSTNLKKPDDLLHLDPQKQPYHYFTQQNFFNPAVEGILAAEKVKTQGITLDELARMAHEGWGLHAKAYHADEFRSLHEFRHTLSTALSNNQFVIVNFLRDGISENMGGGHHSPLAAYDIDSDRFLLLDVARYKYPSYWVKTKDLWNAINTDDSTSEKTRGILVLTDTTPANPPEEIQE
jgi:hypothetical protein